MRNKLSNSKTHLALFENHPSLRRVVADRSIDLPYRIRFDNSTEAKSRRISSW